MPISRLELKNFTAFNELSLDFSPKINVLLGTNGTGKTHIMKVIYAACAVKPKSAGFATKLVKVFRPRDEQLGRLVNRAVGRRNASVKVSYSLSSEDPSSPHIPLFPKKKTIDLSVSFSNLVKKDTSEMIRTRGVKNWEQLKLEGIYIPVKEILSNSPGFLSLYNKRDIAFDEVYYDIISKAQLPLLKGRSTTLETAIINKLKKALGGTVTLEKEEFYLKGSAKQGKLEFPLLAEGLRKLGLLWVLVQNGVLSEHSILFWDEPEANLSPANFELVVDILLELQEQGVQIFLATHDYLFAQQLNRKGNKSDAIKFHHLTFAEDKENQPRVIKVETVSEYEDTIPNEISKAFDKLYDDFVQDSIK